MLRPRSRSWLPLVCLVIAVVCSARPLADDPALAASNGDAFVSRDAAGASWTVGNSAIQFSVGFSRSRTLTVESFWSPANGAQLDVDQTADTSITLNGDKLALTQSGTLSFTGAKASATDAGVQLEFTFEHTTLHTIVRRFYVCYPGTPTIETWTRFEAPAGAPPVAVSDMSAWTFTMPLQPVRWINGLRGDNASQPVPPGDSFAVDGGDLDEGETDIGSTARSSEAFVPLIFVGGDVNEFYGGVIWSGEWRIAMTRAADRVTVAATFPGISTALTPDRPIEVPHAFFGYAPKSADAEAAALRQFAVNGIRRGRPIQPLVTYNTWFPYGTSITEADVDEEMHRASALGVELFVLDAGWWLGAGKNGQADYTSGLGSWTADPERFPARLIGLADEAHDLGMKFGLWVEPERIALETLRMPGGANEQWLATTGGSYNTDGRSAIVCLAAPAARKWLLSKLTTLMDSVHPDYLKWDNNAWTNCDRAGHGHGETDGNYSHVMGLYTVLDELRRLYPDLLIENVSGGGNRLDYGMLAYTDSAWMDDLSAPSSHVRHNIEGLSKAFPPAYLLSFVINSAQESIYDYDLAQIVRSRMPGVLGLTYRFTDLDDDLRQRLAAEITRYKLLRDTITSSAAALLTPQAPVSEDGWDILQEVSDDHRNAIVFAFKNDSDDGTTVVWPRGLDADTMYGVRSVDNGDMGSASGADLMRDGVQLVHAWDGSRAHLIVFTAQ